MPIRPVLLSLAVVLGIACSATSQTLPAGADPTAGSQEASSLKPIDGTQVIARVNDQAVLACEVLWEVNLIIEENLDRIPPDQIEMARQQILQNQLRSYLEMRIAYVDFLSSAKQVNMEGIRQSLEEPFMEGGPSGDAPGTYPGLMKALNVSTRAELDQRLLELGTSLSDRRDAFAERNIAMQWMREKVKVQKPTHADMVEYYQQHLDDYSYPRQVKWEELMVRFDNHPNKIAARAKLVAMGNQAFARQQATPATSQPLLGDIARRESEGYNAPQGGVYDWTTEGSLRHETVDKAIFSLPVGALSPILESDIGFHIVRVVERREAGQTPFQELQQEIEEKIHQERFAAEMKKAIVDLRRNVRIWTIFTGETSADAYFAPRQAMARP